MSRSRKKAIAKMHGYCRDIYHRILRSHNKQKLDTLIKKGDIDSISFSIDDKNVVNDYDYNDYISNCEGDKDCYCMKKFGRKKCSEK